MIRARRWLPHPTLSLFLLMVWLLLMNAVQPGVVAFGLLLAWGVPFLTRVFWPDVPHVSSTLGLLRYFLRLLGDIVSANLTVAWLILGRLERLQPAWVEVPLDLQDPFAITLLASTISLTPGTVSADISADRRSLLIHSLNTDDPEALVREIKQRYEAPLKELFE